MGAQGTATLDFGAFPGKSDAFVDVATAGVVSTSLVEGWMHGGTATADHSIDEHMVETIKVWAKYLSDGNIRIYGLNTNQIHERPPEAYGQGLGSRTQAAGGAALVQGSAHAGNPENVHMGSRIYGQWTVAWVWN